MVCILLIVVYAVFRRVKGVFGKRQPKNQAGGQLGGHVGGEDDDQDEGMLLLGDDLEQEQVGDTENRGDPESVYRSITGGPLKHDTPRTGREQFDEAVQAAI